VVQMMSERYLTSARHRAVAEWLVAGVRRGHRRRGTFRARRFATAPHLMRPPAINCSPIPRHPFWSKGGQSAPAMWTTSHPFQCRRS